jgi:hypothetical protein
VLVRKEFHRVSRLAPIGDVNGDGWPDLAGAGAKGVERVYLNDGKNGIGATAVLRERVAGVDQVGLGLWDGDKVPDTAVRRADGTLWVWSSATGKSVRVATGTNQYDWFLGLGDVDGDGRSDIVVRKAANGDLVLLPGRSSGFGEARLIGTGFGGYDLGS